jgi:hypothetical protein
MIGKTAKALRFILGLWLRVAIDTAILKGAHRAIRAIRRPA